MTTQLNYDLLPKLPKANMPLAPEVRAELVARAARTPVMALAADLGVVPATLRSAARGAPLTRSVAVCLTVMLGFPPPKL